MKLPTSEVKEKVSNRRFYIGVVVMLCIFYGVINFGILLNDAFSGYIEVRLNETRIEKQIWFEECLTENKQYKCDYMWKD